VSRSEELRPELGSPRVIAALVALLGAPDPATARAAALALNNLAVEEEGRRRMADAGAVHALVDMVRAGRGAVVGRCRGGKVRQQAPEGGGRAGWRRCSPTGAPANPPAWPSAPQMASSDAIGQEAAAAALMMLASEEAYIRAAIVAANGVAALVSVLQVGAAAGRHKRPSLQRQRPGEQQAPCTAHGSSPSHNLPPAPRPRLPPSPQYGGPTAQESAAAALENLSLDSSCEAALGQEGGVEGLLGLLRDGTPAAQVRVSGD
jgi:hypothetical protein